MRKRRGFLVGVAFSAGVILGWIAARASGQGEPEPRMAARPTTSSWIRGEGDQRFGQIENHFRGLDVAMAEIGYRYTELFFAVQDRNWEYADYQLGKIEVVLKLAIERRPKRAPSATAFLTQDWPFVQAGLRSHKPDTAAQALERLRAACMKCHVSEQVPYFTLRTPDRRLAPIGTEPE
jgi:hypothetical protein